MSELLHRCITKATTAEGDDIRYSLNWVLARRGTLKVWTDALVCGDWRIPYSEIEEAVLIRTSQMFIPGYVLRVKSHGAIYQFGLNLGRYWTRELPFPVRREKARLGYSRFSIILRVVIIIAIVAYVLWRRLK